MVTKICLTACLMAFVFPRPAWTNVINHNGRPATSTNLHPSTTARPTIVCTSTATATWFATSGCAIPCGTQVQCIGDYGVGVPCGCDRVSVTVTTTTICPRISPCIQCRTGWGIATYYSSCPTTPISSSNPTVTPVSPA
ncbi:hypothetical protein B0T14DRAFT_519365 [Immersiella caudata]|uniref:Uncharacterized protein n=1 Tax=Immersiella caudata TaxID=314043 RepID=A0AA40BZS4_9PEZI|nr:hypothetical protein B0T14DRAFT_519365 [Immersiella caudata]